MKTEKKENPGGLDAGKLGEPLKEELSKVHEAKDLVARLERGVAAEAGKKEAFEKKRQDLVKDLRNCAVNGFDPAELEREIEEARRAQFDSESLLKLLYEDLKKGRLTLVHIESAYLASGLKILDQARFGYLGELESGINSAMEAWHSWKVFIDQFCLAWEIKDIFQSAPFIDRLRTERRDFLDYAIQHFPLKPLGGG